MENTEEYETVEAHIELRIRDGIPNTLTTFSARVKDTVENEDGTLEHQMPTSDIIQGLSYALHDAIQSTDLQAWGLYDDWLTIIRDYIFGDVEA